MDSLRIFIVEDDAIYSEVLEYHLSLNPEYEVIKFSSGKECLENLFQNPSLITLDYSLPDLDGGEVLKKIKDYNPDIPVVIISGQEDISTALNLLKDGAYDYIVKDDDTKKRVWNVIKNIRENIELKTELNSLREEINNKYSYDNSIKGNSAVMQQVFKLIEKACKTNITTSITGETGTGKELVAKAIHYNSDKKRKPFIAVNVSAIPKDLIESELFGYEKGAFTGANTRKIGRFEEADGGTLFLDEIGEMGANMQSKLLRVLQERELVRIGSNKPIKFDVRLIVATHRDLSEEVTKGNFREDLYYRLLGLPIELPPLRERGNDILLLAKYFIDDFCSEQKMRKLKISNTAQEKLLNYPFPGNVRELKAVLELAAVMADDDFIKETDISFNSSSKISNLLTGETTLREYTDKIIIHYLEKYNNDIKTVAKKLDIGKSTIYNLLKSQKETVLQHK